jgi:hypothetical protein
LELREQGVDGDDDGRAAEEAVEPLLELLQLALQRAHLLSGTPRLTDDIPAASAHTGDAT